MGRDTLTGGDGGDRFFFFSPDEGIDVITDFLYIGPSFPNDEIWISAEGFGIDIDAQDAFSYDYNTGAVFFENTQIARLVGSDGLGVLSTLTIF